MTKIWRTDYGLCDICNSAIGYSEEYQKARGTAMRRGDSHYALMKKAEAGSAKQKHHETEWRSAIAEWNRIDKAEEAQIDALRKAREAPVVAIDYWYSDEYDSYTEDVTICAKHLRQMLAAIKEAK